MKNKLIPYGKQSIKKDDIKNVVKTLNSDYLTTGPITKNLKITLKITLEASLQALVQAELLLYIFAYWQ